MIGAVLILIIACMVSVYVARLNRALQVALSKHKKELADRKRAEAALRKSEQLRAEGEKLAATDESAVAAAAE